jgi:CubicO group peptidase (beta-lactamase class C family)
MRPHRRMKFRNVICMSAVATCIAFSALAQGLPNASGPEAVGFSSGRLQRLTSAFQAEVDKGAIPGAVVLIARNGEVAYFKAFGFQDREKQVPMKTDAIFRIASMSKPITSVAAMMLVEEGKLQLLDPVSIYLPEFKNLRVGVEKVNPTTGNPELSLEPARREMTVQDLMRHTSGLTYGVFGKSLVKQAYNDANRLTGIRPLRRWFPSFRKSLWLPNPELGRAPYLISAGPRQPCVWGSRTRPLPQPPMRSLADTLGVVMVGREGATPEVTPLGNAGLV